MTDSPLDVRLDDPNLKLSPAMVNAVISQDASVIGEEALAVLTRLTRERLGIIPLRCTQSLVPGIACFQIVGGKPPGLGQFNIQPVTTVATLTA